jgi:hypothetical protein
MLVLLLLLLRLHKSGVDSCSNWSNVVVDVNRFHKLHGSTVWQTHPRRRILRREGKPINGSFEQHGQALFRFFAPSYLQVAIDRTLVRGRH